MAGPGRARAGRSAAAAAKKRPFVRAGGAGAASGPSTTGHPAPPHAGLRDTPSALNSAPRVWASRGPTPAVPQHEGRARGAVPALLRGPGAGSDRAPEGTQPPAGSVRPWRPNGLSRGHPHLVSVPACSPTNQYPDISRQSPVYFSGGCFFPFLPLFFFLFPSSGICCEEADETQQWLTPARSLW